MKIAVVNDSGVRVDTARIRQVAALFLAKAARLAGTGWNDISLVLRDDPGIQSVNRAHLAHDYPTDVISFAYAAIPGDREGRSGEVVVNAARAVRLGDRFGGPERELALYIAHGCDHLTGADDNTPARRRRMRARELRWIRAAQARGLLKGLLR